MGDDGTLIDDSGNYNDIIDPSTGMTLGDTMELWQQAGLGLDPSGNGVGDPGFDWNSAVGQQVANDVQPADFNWGKFLMGALGGGGSGLGFLIPALATIGAGLYGSRNTQRASQQAIQGLENANQSATNLLGPLAGANSIFAPYLQAGQNGINRLNGMNSNLAAGFRPLGAGRGIVQQPSSVTLGALLGR